MIGFALRGDMIVLSEQQDFYLSALANDVEMPVLPRVQMSLIRRGLVEIKSNRPRVTKQGKAVVFARKVLLDAIHGRAALNA